MDSKPSNHHGRIEAIACRPVDGNTMTEVRSCTVLAGRGIDSENRKTGKREVTFISAESWSDACKELGVAIPWHTRRANFLVSGLDLAATIGRTLCIGDVRVQIHGETKPCGIMEAQQAGLRTALEPHCRGGVFGQVLSGGTVEVGNDVTIA